MEASATAPFPLPRTLLFELTQDCNHDCIHCYNVWKGMAPYPAGMLGTRAVCLLFARLAREEGISHVTLTGGEPLLREDLFQIVDHLRRLGIRLNLISNGSLLDAAALKRLCPGKVDLFELPLLSDQRGIHDAMSGAPGAFDRVTRAIVELKRRRQRVIAVFVATNRNLPRWRETLELALALGCDEVMLNRFNPGGRGLARRRELEPPPAALRQALDQAEAFSRQYGLGISCGVPVPPCVLDTQSYEKLRFGRCGAGNEGAYYTLDPAGRLRPCNHSPTILGDLGSASLAEILSGGALARFVAALPAECRGCQHELECRGGCKAAAEQCHGSPDVLDSWIARHCAQC